MMIIHRKLNQCFIWKYSTKQLRPAEGPIRQEQPLSSAIARTFYSEFEDGHQGFCTVCLLPKGFPWTADLLSALPITESSLCCCSDEDYCYSILLLHCRHSCLTSHPGKQGDQGWLEGELGWAGCPMAVLAAGWMTCATAGWLVKEEKSGGWSPPLNQSHLSCFWKNNAI